MGRLRRGGYLPEDFLTAESLAGAADHKLFVSIAGNPHHVLRRYHHEKKSSGHNLRTRAHNFLFPEKDDRNFVSRSIMMNSKLRIFFTLFKFLMSVAVTLSTE